MKTVTKVIVWAIVFIVVLACRFPYTTVFRNAVARVETATGARLTWDTCKIGLTGAKLTGFAVRLPSGMNFAADSVSVRPNFQGFHTDIQQTTQSGKCSVEVGKNALVFHSDNLEVDTGSKDLKTVRMTGDLTYRMSDAYGKGELRLEIAELTGVLPLPLKGLKIGTVTTIEPILTGALSNKNQDQANSDASPTPNTPTSEGAPAGNNVTSGRSVIHNKISLLAQGITGEGNVDLTSNGDGRSPSLAGSLTVKTDGFGNHTITLGGTWAKPEWNLAGARQ